MHMIQRIYILAITAGFLSCGSQFNQIDKTASDWKEALSKNVQNSKYYTQKDAFFIATDIDDTLISAKSNFNKIVNAHTELFQELPEHPDKLYYRFVKEC